MANDEFKFELGEVAAARGDSLSVQVILARGIIEDVQGGRGPVYLVSDILHGRRGYVLGAELQKAKTKETP